MSSGYIDSIDVSPTRDVGHENASSIAAQRLRAVEAAPVQAAAEPSVRITLSAEAKVALEGIRRAAEENAREDHAMRGAKEIAAAAGVSEAEAVQVAQPLRSPPPAKGAALFQANLTAEKSNG